jgi:ATP-binding cassette subfamily C protein
VLNLQTFRFIDHFVRAYPSRTILMVALLILAGLAEGIGVVTLFPLLELALHEASSPSSQLTRAAVFVLGALNIQPTWSTRSMQEWRSSLPTSSSVPDWHQ